MLSIFCFFVCIFLCFQHLIVSCATSSGLHTILASFPRSLSSLASTCSTCLYFLTITSPRQITVVWNLKPCMLWGLSCLFLLSLHKVISDVLWICQCIYWKILLCCRLGTNRLDTHWFTCTGEYILQICGYVVKAYSSAYSQYTRETKNII